MAERIKSTTHKPKDYFCFLSSGENSYPALDALIESLPEQIRTPVQAFKRNLRATALTATIPCQMAFASLWRRTFELNLLIEQMESSRNAHVRANEKLKREMSSKRGRKRNVDYILHILSQDLEREETRFAARELIRQCSVQIWSAFEVFASDIFESFLNAKPDLVRRLMQNESIKKLFQLRGIPFEILTEYQFNLSSKMGSLLLEHSPIDTIPSMKAVFGGILPNHKEVAAALSEKNLWLLFQRRHLIVHRRGIVDRRYLAATGEKLSLGTDLVVFPSELQSYMETVLKAGSTIGLGVAFELRKPSRGKWQVQIEFVLGPAT